jgi:hypothetical protein
VLQIFSNHSAEKRVAAQKAEVDFFALLREHELSSPDILWKDVIMFPIAGRFFVNIISS